jgi:hypothetical protein
MNEKRVTIQAAKDVGSDLNDYNFMSAEIAKWQKKQLYPLKPG